LLQQLFVWGKLDDCLPESTTKEELESACFPKYFVLYHKGLQDRTNPFLRRTNPFSHPPTVKMLTNGGPPIEFDNFDGSLFQSTRPVRMGGTGVVLMISQDLDWELFFTDSNGYKIILCRSPNSGNLVSPPATPWISAHPSTRGWAPMRLEHD